MSSAPNPSSVPPPAQALPCAQADKHQVVHSSALLGSRQTIEIEHNGQRYRLQSTKAGKLILTK